jgi:hypothetical protein
LATEVIELKSERWWQDMLAEAMASAQTAKRLTVELGLSTLDFSKPNTVRIVTARVAELPESDRQNLLSKYVATKISVRQMLCTEDISGLKPLLSIGGHGHTHSPLSESHFVTDELCLSRDCLLRLGACHDVMSFPHGACTEKLMDVAQLAGFRFLFTSTPRLVNIEALRQEMTAYGRIHIPENQWTCENNGISCAKLATFLFFRPVA